ncbi:Hypothetical predicted protein [Paramuricea clavata]|uniref:Uncharacterized protein n=1 Tax=Paramuricea clavata TaxID=317549 RepID=A0A7D9DWX6_PARCT|nr:Hypothetical predicted protein [Paramuricea clavata]
MNDFNLLQIITEPTRVTDNTSTLLDHLFTSAPHRILSSKIPKIGLSDHYPTCTVFKDSFGRKHSHNTIRYRCYKNFDEEIFCKDLAQIPWDIIDVFDDVDDALDAWYNLYLEVVDKHLSWREKRVKSTPSSLRDDSDQSTITDAKGMCEHFNNYFSTIVIQYIENQNHSANFDKLTEMVNSNVNDDVAFSIPPITDEEVYSHLLNFETHKATGLDGLSHKILKISANFITPSLTKVFNNSLSAGVFPTIWKASKIIPVHKAGPLSDVHNFRPIAILCAVSKILERHFYNHF